MKTTKIIPFDIALREQIQSEENHYQGRYKVQTRDGNDVKIIYWDRRDRISREYSIVGLQTVNDTEFITTCTKDGKYSISAEPNNNDLVLIDTWEPELKESEDERIRKDLITYLESDRDSQPCQDVSFYDSSIAWLEKQKDAFENGRQLGIMQEQARQELELTDEKQKESLRDFIDDFPYSAEKEERDYRKVYEDIDQSGWFRKEYIDKRINEEFEQKEQKPAEWSEEDEKDTAHIIRILDDCYAYGKHDLSKTDHENLVNKLKSLCPQSKQEWSEDDKFKLEDAITGIDAGIGFYETEGKHPNLLKAIIEAKEWLKSLRPQPKAKLTLLDKNIINAAVAFVEQNDHFNCWGGIDKHTVIKALRSLKPHWKPSEEQMKALEYASHGWKELEINVLPNKTLQSLYNDLKKL